MADDLDGDGGEQPPQRRNVLTDLRGQVLYEEYEEVSGYHLVVINIDGSGYRRIAGGFGSRVSPDGRQVAHLESLNWDEFALVVRKIDGSGERHVASIGRDGWPGSWPGAPAWAPTGEALLYAAPSVDCSSGLACLPTRDGGIWTVRPDGTGRTKLIGGAGLDPTWSSDGSRIAFGRSSELVVAAAHDGSEQRVVHRAPNGTIREPSFSPDGKWLAFQVVREAGGRPVLDVGVARVDGRDSRLVWRDGPWSAVREPQWSPDGSRIVFSDAAKVVVMRSDGTGVIELGGTNHTGDPMDVYASSPSWSPDGEWIIFGAVDQRFGKLRRLHVARPDGSGLTEIPNALLGESPQWWW